MRYFPRSRLSVGQRNPTRRNRRPPWELDVRPRESLCYPMSHEGFKPIGGAGCWAVYFAVHPGNDLVGFSLVNHLWGVRDIFLPFGIAVCKPYAFAITDRGLKLKALIGRTEEQVRWRHPRAVRVHLVGDWGHNICYSEIQSSDPLAQCDVFRRPEDRRRKPIYLQSLASYSRCRNPYNCCAYGAGRSSNWYCWVQSSFCECRVFPYNPVN